MAIGDWMLGNFIPSNVVSAEYSMKEITLNCASFKKDDGSDPVDEILQVQYMVAYGSDNSDVIGGTILQSYNPDDIHIITDGFESFYGVITNVITPENQMSDYYIAYQIIISRFVPPKGSSFVGILADGDETVWDDDWEWGYEMYNVSDSTGGCTPDYTVSYSAGQTYNNVTVYRHQRIEGAPYHPDYGYLQVPLNRHTIPYNLTGQTVVIDFGEEYLYVFLIIGFGGQGVATIGEFGEVIYVPATTVPPAILTVNGKQYTVPWVSGSSMDNIIAQQVAIKISSRYLVMRVNTNWVVHTIQKIIPTNDETIDLNKCNEMDNRIPLPGGGLSSGGSSGSGGGLGSGGGSSGGGLGGGSSRGVRVLKSG